MTLHQVRYVRRLLRVYDATAALPHMHLEATCLSDETSCTCDCTHWCWVPSFWSRRRTGRAPATRPAATAALLLLLAAGDWLSDM